MDLSFSGTPVFISGLGKAAVPCWVCAASVLGALRVPSKALQLLNDAHVLWHRRSAARVLVLAQHFSLLAQKNIIELFYCALFWVLVPFIRQSPPPAEDSKQGIRKGLLPVDVSWQGNEQGNEQGNAGQGSCTCPAEGTASPGLHSLPALLSTDLSCVSHITAFPGLWWLCPPFSEGPLPCGRFSTIFCAEELIFHNR